MRAEELPTSGDNSNDALRETAINNFQNYTSGQETLDIPRT